MRKDLENKKKENYNNGGGKMTKDLVDKIIAYECGLMDSEEEVIEFFQYLIDTGLAWSLQGHYGRTASALIEAGYCQKK
jgi:hypothetical protein